MASLDKDQIADNVIQAVGGLDNIEANGVCMTRLRLSVYEPSKVSDDTLNEIPGVLGVRHRGEKGLEVVFGPRIVDEVWGAFVARTGLPPKDGRTFFTVEEPESVPTPAASNVRNASGNSFTLEQVQSFFSRKKSPDAKAVAPTAPEGNPAGPTAEATTSQASPDTEAKPQQKSQDAPRAAESPAGTTTTMGAKEATRMRKQGSTDDIDELVKLLDHKDKTSSEDGRYSYAPGSSCPVRNLLVINGPNINMLGIREPSIYGTKDYPSLVRLCQKSAREAGFARCECYQSNHEGDIVDKIQEAYGVYDGIVINPAAYTHTSVAILDALKAVSIPAVEVHISHVDQRESFRRISFVRLACFETVSGLGFDGYTKAINDLAAHIGLKQPK